MKLSYILESATALHPIPDGYARLTHFTSPSVARAILDGEPFQYKMINSTTDSFSDDKDVAELLTTGKTAAYERSGFGTSVLIIDLTNNEHRLHMLVNPPGYVDNSRVAGVYDRTTGRFIGNPNYNPAKEVKYPERGASTTLRNRPNQSLGRPTSQPKAEVPEMSPARSDSVAADEVW